MMKRLIGLVLVLFSINSLAALEVYDVPGTSEYFVVAPEQGHWFLDRYQASNGQLPNKTSHQAFETREQALKAMSHWNFTALVSLKNIQAQYVTESSSVIWKAENQWSWEWEKKYSQWIKDNVTKMFFHDNKIRVDCADVAISLKWIFSRIHKLPMANSISGGKVLFSNESMKSEWERLPTHADWKQDRRFLAALNYVLSQSYTHTLFNDSYPVELSQESFIPGVHHLTLFGKTGHTQLVHRVSSDLNEVPAQLIASTVPREARILMENLFSADQQQDPKMGSLLRIRWARKSAKGWNLTPGTEMPFYSLMQYDPKTLGDKTSLTHFIFTIINPNFDPVVVLKAQARDIKSALEARVQIVEDGFQYCQTNDCRPGTVGYENWSTPSRDRHIEEKFRNFEDLSYKFTLITPEVQKWKDEEVKKEYLHFKGESYTFTDLQIHWSFHFFDSNPLVSVERRWNFSVESFLESRRDLIKDLVIARVKKIQQNTCVQGRCQFGDEKYKSSHTFKTDRDIQVALADFKKFCNLYTSKCDHLNTLLSTARFSWFNEEINFQQAQRQALLMSSDPRDSERWGNSESQSLFLPVKSCSMNINENEQYRTYQSMSGTLVLNKGRFHIENVFSDAVAMAVKENRFVWIKDQNIFLGKALRSSKVISVPSAIPAKVINSISDDYFFTAPEKRSIVVNPTSKRSKKINAMPPPQVSYKMESFQIIHDRLQSLGVLQDAVQVLGKQAWLGRWGDSKVWTLFDFRNGSYKKHDLTLAFGESVNLVAALSDDVLLLATNEYMKSPQFIQYDLSKGTAAHVLNLEPGTVNHLSGSTFYLRKMDMTGVIYEFSADLKDHSELKISSQLNTSHFPVLVQYSIDGAQKFFKYQSGELKKLDLGEAQGVFGAYGDLVARYVAGQQDLYDTSTGQTVLDGYVTSTRSVRSGVLGYHYWNQNLFEQTDGNFYSPSASFVHLFENGKMTPVYKNPSSGTLIIPRNGEEWIFCGENGGHLLIRQ